MIKIDNLNLSLPHGFESRAHGISKHISEGLAGHGRGKNMRLTKLPPLNINIQHEHSNAAIGGQIAREIAALTSKLSGDQMIKMTRAMLIEYSTNIPPLAVEFEFNAQNLTRTPDYGNWGRNDGGQPRRIFFSFSGRCEPGQPR